MAKWRHRAVRSAVAFLTAVEAIPREIIGLALVALAAALGAAALGADPLPIALRTGDGHLLGLQLQGIHIDYAPSGR